MGWNIWIGNATLQDASEDDGELIGRYVVDLEVRDDAPTFKHDEMTGKSNSRFPSYGGWDAFVESAKLRAFFHDEDDGLMREHPGCFRITQYHADIIAATLADRRRVSSAPPGFSQNPDFTDDDGQPVDPLLARLIWLDYWMRWALANCERPAIQNS